MACRPITSLIRAAVGSGRRPFHTSRPSLISQGESIPSLRVLMERSPGNKVDLAEEFAKGDGLIIGVPAAFSPACSARHVPGYMNHPALTDVGKQLFIVAVNDAFVMQAWQESLDPSGKSGFRFLADPSAAFTRAVDMAFDGSAVFGGDRSKRYAIIVREGKASRIYVEPDNTGTNVSMAENVLGNPTS